MPNRSFQYKIESVDKHVSWYPTHLVGHAANILWVMGSKPSASIFIFAVGIHDSRILHVCLAERSIPQKYLANNYHWMCLVDNYNA